MTGRRNPRWPVLREYAGDHLGRIAMPVGGIGTGTVSLGGRGDLRDWEIMNRPAKGYVPRSGRGGSPSFVLYASGRAPGAVTRLIEGPIEPHDYEGDSGCSAPNHGLPRFSECSFAAAYPLAQIRLADRDVPVAVRIEAFNPLIPGDADSSGIPVAALRFVLTNRTRKGVTAAICASMPNFIGADGSAGEPKGNRNTFRAGNGVRGIYMESVGVGPKAEQWGTVALVTTATKDVTYRTSWLGGSGWGTPLLDFWDDFSSDGALDERASGADAAPMASLAAKVRIPPRGSSDVTFLIAWHFPNRRTWSPRGGEGPEDESDTIGNYYAGRYGDAWHVAESFASRLSELEDATVRFVRAFCGADLPTEVKEAALFNLSTLRSQTCFRTPDGHLFGWEGTSDRRGCCHGSCTHVWNYEQALAFLFGDLALGMREVEFAHATDERGLMSFRVNLPISRAREFGRAAADGQMGCIMKLYRDWQLSGDDDALRRLWPKARKALTFSWIPGGWDADRDGVMEGCQHNTMDVEYYGPNPQMGSWYLGALRAAEEMSRHLGDDDFARGCRELFERGGRWMDEHLFNGEYYEHEIRPAGSADAISDGLRLKMGAADPTKPDYQLGPGCLVDQLVGQYMSHICGLGYLLDRKNVGTTLRSVMKYNLRRSLRGHFNCLRSFALGGESALLMAAYPKGRPANPFPYFTEVMTGFEYAAAVGMIQEGQVSGGLECIRNIRARYDGRRRNPFDEAECGHHYARAMASWAAVIALTGFRYSAVTGAMEFAATEKPATFFWSNGRAWGTLTQRPAPGRVRAELSVMGGELRLSRLSLGVACTAELDPGTAVPAGRSLKLDIKKRRAAGK